MNWFQCILYGFVLGISEFIPVSSGAQGTVLQLLFGTGKNDAIRELIVHIFSLLGFLIAWRNPLSQLINNRYISSRSGNRNRHIRENHDSRFVRSAMLPMLLIMILSFYFWGSIAVIPMVIVLILNGILLYLPERMLQGNKSSRSMSALDAWLVGIAGGLGATLGFSRVGLCISSAQMRGADRKNALNWAYMLSIPAMLLFIATDLVMLVFGSQTHAYSTGFGGYLLMAISSFVGSYLSVYLLRNAVLNRSLSAFAYYSWGTALFLFILYLL